MRWVCLSYDLAYVIKKPIGLLSDYFSSFQMSWL